MIFEIMICKDYMYNEILRSQTSKMYKRTKAIFPLIAFWTASVLPRRAQNIDFYGQSISHKLENAKKNKCITLGISLQKQWKSFKNNKILIENWEQVYQTGF